MQVYTSSFKFAKGLNESKYFVVSISRFPPRGFRGYKCFEFAPSVRLLKEYKEGLRNDHYAYRYERDVLKKTDVHRVFEGLARMACGRDIVLCCFEPALQFCHRRILAHYVERVWGYSIKELW